MKLQQSLRTLWQNIVTGLSALWNRVYAMKWGRQRIIIVVSALVVVALIIVGIVLLRGDDGDHASNGPVITNDVFNTSTFQTDTIQRTVGESVTIARIPVTGDADTDAVIRARAQEFIDTNNKLATTGSITYLFSAHAYEKYLSVVLYTENQIQPALSPLTIIVTHKGKAVNWNKLLDAEAEAIIAGHIVEALGSRFGTPNETASTLAKTAWINKQYRPAVNGIVALIPHRDIPGAPAGVAYHEVLIPNEALDDVADL